MPYSDGFHDFRRGNHWAILIISVQIRICECDHFCSLLSDAPGRHLPEEQEELDAAVRRQRRLSRGRGRERRGRQEGRVPPLRRGVRHSLCHAGNAEIG